MNEHEPPNQNREDKEKEKKKIFDGIENLVGEVNKAVRITVEKATNGAEQFGENIKDTFEGMKSNRDSVVMVRMDKESKDRLDELIEAGVVSSRSEAAAFLIMEGIKARQPLFDKISAKIDEIRNAKEELRRLLVDEDGVGAAHQERPSSEQAP